MLSLLTMVGRLISTENPVVCIHFLFPLSIISLIFSVHQFGKGGHGVKEVWRRDGLQAEPGREVKVGKLKSAASKRTVPLNDTAIAMIQDLRKETYFGEDTPLVPGEHGNFTRPVNFRKRYYRILAAAGIEKKGLHSLRHTFATLALQNGVDVKTVSSILGHFSAGFTLDTYAHVTTTAQREAAKKMDGVLGQRVP